MDALFDSPVTQERVVFRFWQSEDNCKLVGGKGAPKKGKEIRKKLSKIDVDNQLEFTLKIHQNFQRSLINEDCCLAK